MEAKLSKSRIPLQQAEYFDGCTTAAEVELRFTELMRFLEEQTPSVKTKKQLCRTAQLAIPRLARTYRSIPSLLSILNCASLLIVSCCEFRPASWIQFAQEMLEPLSNPRVDKAMQVRLAKLLPRAKLLQNNFSRDMLTLFLECIAKCSKHYPEVGAFLEQAIAEVLMTNQAVAAECLLSLSGMLAVPAIKEATKSILQSERLCERIDLLLVGCLANKTTIPCCIDLIHLGEGIYSNFLTQLSKEPYEPYTLSLLSSIVSCPELQFFVKFQGFYSALVRDPQLTEQMLLAFPNILSLRWDISQQPLTESNERAVFSLQALSEEAEKRLIEAVSCDSHFLLKLEPAILSSPHTFTVRFYKQLFGVSKARNKLMQLIGIVLSRVYSDKREVWEISYPFIQLYALAAESFDGDCCDFKFLLFELTYSSFAKILSHLFIEFFRENVSGSDSRIRLVERFFGEDVYLWAQLLEGAVCPPKALLWFRSCCLIRLHLSEWLERNFQSTQEFLRLSMEQRNIKAITAFWSLIGFAEPNSKACKLMAPYLAKNFGQIANLFAEKETAFNKIVYQEGIHWDEHHYKIYAEQRQLEKKMSRVLIRSVVAVLAHTQGLHRYLPEQCCAETLSQALLGYVADHPNDKADLYDLVLRAVGRLEHVSSTHLFARQVQPIKKMELQRHANLTAYACCLKQVAFFKEDFPELSLEWSWRFLCESALLIVRANLKDFSLERDVLRAKLLALEACELIIPNIKDLLLLKDLFQQLMVLLEANSKTVSAEESGQLLELRCQTIRLVGLLAAPLAKFKKLQVEYIQALQSVIIDQSEELRVVVLRMAVDGRLRDPCLLMLLATADPNQAIRVTAAAFLQAWFEVAEPHQIGNLIIHLLFFLKNSAGVAQKELFTGNLCSYLNQRSICYAVEALEALKQVKIVTYGPMSNHRTVHGRKSQLTENSVANENRSTQPTTAPKDSMDSFEQQLKKRAKALKVKAAKARMLALTQHILIQGNP